MAKASDNKFPKVQFSEEAAPDTPSTGEAVIYVKADGKLYLKDDAGTETDLTSGGSGTDADAIHDNVSGEIAAATEKASPVSADLLLIEDSEASNVKKKVQVGNLPGGSGSSGLCLIAMPAAADFSNNSGFQTSADVGFAIPINVPASMQLQGLAMQVGTGAAGTYEWGLFDFSSAPSAATKIAGGSGALSASNSVSTIAATSAPISIEPGGYMIVYKTPSAAVAEVARTRNAVSGAWGAMKYQNSSSWNDTPDFTTGWNSDAGVMHVALVGRLDAANQW